jgi:hypothetical protein
LTTILIDGSSPAIATQATGSVATVVSAAFVPPGGSVLAIRYSANTIDPNDPGTPTITDSLSTHLIYVTQDVDKRPDSPLAEGQAASWTAVVPDGTPSMTITVTNGAASPNRHAALRVLVLTGVDQVTPVGQHGKSSSLSASSIAASYTATRPGSLGLLATCDWNDVGAQTAGGAGNTLEGSADIAASFVYGFLRRTAADGVAGATTTITATIPGTSTSLRWVWLEMLPGPDGTAPPRPLGLSANMPIPMRMAAMRYMSWPDAAATTPIMPDAGTALLPIIATGTAVKVAPQTGSTVVPVRASGTAVKAAPEVGRAALAPIGTGTDVKKAPQVGAAIVGIRTTGIESTADIRAQTGTAVVGLRGLGDGRKRGVQVGPAAVALVAAGTARKAAPQAGATEVAVRASGVQVHQQAQRGAAAVAARASGIATSRTATQTGRAEAGIAATGTAAKKAPEVGTAAVAVTAAGFQTSGTARAQTGAAVLPLRSGGDGRKRAVLTGAAMVAFTGNGSAVKRAPQAGAAVLAARASGTAVKRGAAAGKSSFITTPGGVAGKRTAATGRTVVPLLSFGNQAPPIVAPVRLGDRLNDILNALISFTKRLGIFQAVQGHEPKGAPRNNLTAALWLQAMAPAIGQSGLESTSLRVAWFLRIYQNFLSEPQDAIDPKVMRAMASVMEALTANFDLDIPQVRAIDLLGITGPPMAAEAGYIEINRTMYRCMTLTIPIIVDDAFVQVA